MKKITYALIALFALIVLAGCPTPSTPEVSNGTLVVSIGESKAGTEKAYISITDSNDKLIVNKEEVTIPANSWKKELATGYYVVSVLVGDNEVLERNVRIESDRESTVNVEDYDVPTEKPTTGVLSVDVSYEGHKINIIVRKGSADSNPIYNDTAEDELKYSNEAAEPGKYYVTIKIDDKDFKTDMPMTVTAGLSNSRIYNTW